MAESFATYPFKLSHTCTVSPLFKLLLKDVYTTYCTLSFFKKKIVSYRSVYKIEPESLENAEIRFLSSWSFIYLSA